MSRAPLLCSPTIRFVPFQIKVFVSLIVASISAIAATSTAQSSKGKLTKESVNKMIESWPETSKSAAKATMEKYGAPNEATQSQLIWHNNGAWKRTIVYSEEIQHNFPMPHKDVLEQFVDMDHAPIEGSKVVEHNYRTVIKSNCWSTM